MSNCLIASPQRQQFAAEECQPDRKWNNGNRHNPACFQVQIYQFRLLLKLYEFFLSALSNQLGDSRVKGVKDWSGETVGERSQRPRKRVIAEGLERKNLGKNDLVNLREQKSKDIDASYSSCKPSYST